MQSLFPDVPRESPAVQKDGNFTHLWELYFGELSQSLQSNYKNEGIIFPPLSAANMTTIQNLYTSYVGGTYDALTFKLPDISGQTVFDTTTYNSNQFVVAQNNAGNVTLAEWVPFQMTIVNAGTPVATLAGVLNWMCYDTVNGALYICTTAGAAGTAVWTQLTSGSGGGVSSVSGTAHRITSTGGANPVIDIASDYVGQGSITTLGTIATGTWQGSVVGPTYGGTGVNNGSNTLTLGGSLATSGAFASTFTMTAPTSVTFPTSGTLATTSQLPTPSALTKSDDTNVTLTLGGSPTVALLAATSLTLGWTGTLSGARGGTGVANTGLTINLGSATSGYILTSDVSGNATWAANPGTGSITTIDGDSGSATPSGGVITINGGTTGLTTLGSSHALSLTGTLKLANGGTNANLTASNGGIFYSTSTAAAILSGTATANLPLLSGSTAAPSWGSYALSLGGALTTAGALTTSGAYGVTFTFTNTTSVTFPTSGTLATTSQLPTPAALTKADDTNVTLTLGGTPATALLQATSITAGWTGTLSGARGGTGVANTGLTINLGSAATGYVLTSDSSGNATWAAPLGGTGLTWAANSNATITAAVGNGYILTHGTATTVNLPTTFAAGSQIGIAGQGAAWTAVLGASTNIKGYGNTYTTSIASTNNTDSVVLLATVANTSWTMININSTGLTAS